MINVVFKIEYVVSRRRLRINIIGEKFFGFYMFVYNYIDSYKDCYMKVNYRRFGKSGIL